MSNTTGYKIKLHPRTQDRIIADGLTLMESLPPEEVAIWLRITYAAALTRQHKLAGTRGK
jgi:hypothetical protein